MNLLSINTYTFAKYVYNEKRNIRNQIILSPKKVSVFKPTEEEKD
jgi:hypothetical protein